MSAKPLSLAMDVVLARPVEGGGYEGLLIERGREDLVGKRHQLRCLLLAVAEWADKFGDGWAWNSSLSRYAEMPRRQVQRYLADLRDLGLVTIRHTRKRRGRGDGPLVIHLNLPFPERPVDEPFILDERYCLTSETDEVQGVTGDAVKREVQGDTGDALKSGSGCHGGHVQGVTGGTFRASPVTPDSIDHNSKPPTLPLCVCDSTDLQGENGHTHTLPDEEKSEGDDAAAKAWVDGAVAVCGEKLRASERKGSTAFARACAERYGVGQIGEILEVIFASAPPNGQPWAPMMLLFYASDPRGQRREKIEALMSRARATAARPAPAAVEPEEDDPEARARAIARARLIARGRWRATDEEVAEEMAKALGA